MWAFGGCIDNEWREMFNTEWRTRISVLINSTVLLIPTADSVFDYHIDVVTGTVTPWYQHTAPRNCSSNIRSNATAASTIVVPTVAYKSTTYMLETVTRAGQHILVTGPYGSGKSFVIQNHLQRVYEDNTAIQTVNIHLDYYSTAHQLQSQLEGDNILAEQGGHSYGPASNINKLIYFIEDLNLPDSTLEYSIDSNSSRSGDGMIHDTSPAALVRQWMNYNGW
jgi:P-loop containing dynein motor region/Dynein heavy chain AAA lid domain